MVARVLPVVGLADPPPWLLLERPKPVPRITKPEMENLGLAPDLSRLPREMRDLIEHGNRGEYPSRSEADWAVCVAMFRAGYGLDEAWIVMTSPENGISEKYFEEGDRGEDYLELTISKAHACWKAWTSAPAGGRSRTYAHRRGRPSLG